MSDQFIWVVTHDPVSTGCDEWAATAPLVQDAYELLVEMAKITESERVEHKLHMPHTDIWELIQYANAKGVDRFDAEQWPEFISERRNRKLPIGLRIEGLVEPTRSLPSGHELPEAVEVEALDEVKAGLAMTVVHRGYRHVQGDVRFGASRNGVAQLRKNDGMPSTFVFGLVLVGTMGLQMTISSFIERVGPERRHVASLIDVASIPKTEAAPNLAWEVEQPDSRAPSSSTVQ